MSEVKSDLFKDVKYCMTGTIEPEVEFININRNNKNKSEASFGVICLVIYIKLTILFFFIGYECLDSTNSRKWWRIIKQDYIQK